MCNNKVLIQQSKSNCYIGLSIGKTWLTIEAWKYLDWNRLIKFLLVLHFNSESITEFKKETNKTSRYYYITHFKSIKIFAAFTIFVQKIPRMRFERMIYRLEVVKKNILQKFSGFIIICQKLLFLLHLDLFLLSTFTHFC